MSVKSAHRALKLLELFAEVKQPLTQKQIIGLLKYPQSSTGALLRSLSNDGYLNYNCELRTYFPTPQVNNLGSWMQPTQNTLHSLCIIARRLSVTFEETVALAVRNDLFAQYLMAYAPEESTHHVHQGSMLPLTDSSVGWLILSRQPDEAIDRICRRINFRKREKIDLRAVVRSVTSLRGTDHCYVNDAHSGTRFSTISMLLPLEYNDQVVALGVGGITDRIKAKHDRIVELMRTIVSGNTFDLLIPTIGQSDCSSTAITPA